MNFCTLAAIAAVSTLAAGAASALASAPVLYDNGPINGTIQAYTLNYGWAESNSFTLTKAATVTGATFGAWTFPGDSISAIDWGITSTPDNYVDTATATVWSGPTTSNSDGYDIGVDIFSIGPVHLGPGTYYLVLQNASVTYGDPAYWDENDGPSTATQNNGTGPIGSESFQILGSAVPEPSSWALMMVGVGALGATMRSRKNALTRA